MLRLDIRLDNFINVCILCVCFENYDVEGVKFVYCGLLVIGLEIDLICNSVFVSVYLKFGFVDDVSKVFFGIDDFDLGIWNLMIYVYGYNGYWDKGVRLFSVMRNVGVKLDGYVVVVFFLVLVELGLLEIG